MTPPDPTVTSSNQATGLPGANTAHNLIEPANAYILVVEDNIQNFVLIARLMAFLGVKQCQWKASGWQVLEFADSMPRVDLILMDIHLPYEDGFEALTRLRATSDRTEASAKPGCCNRVLRATSRRTHRATARSQRL